ncbi:substrate-binding domain-containing protein [Agromyces sp. LHK192]|uniref:substrate-binding domain-containing protein n=1 Tax=Agromyces sp. LHK192 TaxID=2498704 RepID=UPI000FDA71E9|nr:substrate-binding domain-containing protein [Agromyces sp. LHK192]
MLAAERRARILARAQEDGAVQIARLVEELGVSHVTIRRDLDALVDERVLDKVRGGAMLRPGGEDAGSQHPAQFDGTIGVLVPTSYYYRHVASGVAETLRARGGEMQLVVSEYDADAEARLLDELVRDAVAGILFAPSIQLDDDGAALRRRLAELPVPVVLIERRLPGGGLGGCSSVRTAHELGAAGAAEHLIGLGHRRLAIVSRGRTQSADFVRSGWHDALRRAGLDDDALVLGADELGLGPSWPAGGVEAVLERIREHEATALFCHGDENSLLALMQRARGLGLSVPDDLSIIAYDDEISALADPPLSAVAPDRARVGALATGMLLDRISDASDAPVVHAQVEPRLNIRASTAPPRR